MLIGVTIAALLAIAAITAFLLARWVFVIRKIQGLFHLLANKTTLSHWWFINSPTLYIPHCICLKVCLLINLSVFFLGERSHPDTSHTSSPKLLLLSLEDQARPERCAHRINNHPTTGLHKLWRSNLSNTHLGLTPIALMYFSLFSLYEKQQIQIASVWKYFWT